MTIFTWSVLSMRCYPEKDGATDVVFNVRWMCEGKQDEFVARTSGALNIPVSTDNFMPYDQLVQEQVLGWVWDNGVSKSESESFVQGQIEQMIAPSVVVPPLPWVQEPVDATVGT